MTYEITVDKVLFITDILATGLLLVIEMLIGQILLMPFKCDHLSRGVICLW